MYQATGMAIVRSGSKDLVLRSRRIATTSYAATQLASETLLKQISCLQLDPDPAGPSVAFQVTTLRLPHQIGEAWSREQRLRDDAEARDQHDQVNGVLHQHPRDEANHLVDGIIEIVPEDPNVK